VSVPAAPRPATGLLERWRARLVGWLVDPAVRRRLSAHPLTRPVARRQARALFDLVAGFTYSQVLLACVRLDVFGLLRDGPRSLEALAQSMELAHDPAARLLDAAVALRLLRRAAPDTYALDLLGAPMAGDPGIAAMVEHHALLYADLADPVALLRRGGGGGALQAFWAYARSSAPDRVDPAEVAAYSRLMAASQTLIADEVLDAWQPQGRRTLLDVGGGEGVFLAAVGARAPQWRLMLFDLPPVVERARVRLRDAGLDARVALHGGSFHADALPRGADCISFIRVLHDHDDAQVRHLLRAAREALPRGGELLIAEPMAATGGAEAMGDAYFGLYLLAMGSGRPRSVERLVELLAEAGFGRARALPTRLPIQTRVLQAWAE
jgi:demethylspheroidene O-methyltransferase